MTDFYVYIHTRNDTDEVFYVGKGKGARHSDVVGRNKWWENYTSKHKHSVQLIATGLQEWYAFELEIDLIAYYGRKDLGLGQLLNLTDGGEGSTGMSLAARQAISKAHTGKAVSEDTRAKIGAASIGRKHTDACKQEIGTKMRALKVGKPRPAHVIQAMVQANKTRIRGAKEIEGKRLAMLGNSYGKLLKGIPKSDETKEKMRLAWVKRRASRKDSPAAFGE